jgi:hypothetical protein
MSGDKFQEHIEVNPSHLIGYFVRLRYNDGILIIKDRMG